MTGKQLAALYGRYLRDALPGTAVRRSLVYLHPVGDLLRGCHFESSGPGGTRFVVHAFVQPLYVPFPSVDLIPISRVYCAVKRNVPRAHGSTTGYEHPRVDFSVSVKL